MYECIGFGQEILPFIWRCLFFYFVLSPLYQESFIGSFTVKK